MLNLSVISVTVTFLGGNIEAVAMNCSEDCTSGKAVMMALHALNSDIQIDDWCIVSCGMVRELNIPLESIAIENTAALFVVPPCMTCIKSETELYGIIESVCDIQYHCAPNEQQSKGSASSLVVTLSNFFDFLFIDSSMVFSPLTAFEDKVDQFKVAFDILGQKKRSPGRVYIKWYESYGCALVSRPLAGCRLHISLICLDAWRFRIHSSNFNQEHDSSPSTYDTPSIVVGHIDEALFDEFMTQSDELLSGAKKRTKDQRSARGERQGHQKTPAFIQSILMDAIKVANGVTSAENRPKGGFTDVGLHTGGRSRNTAWPLALSVLSTLLETKECDSILQRFVTQFYLCLAESAISFLTKTTLEAVKMEEMDSTASFHKKLDVIMQCCSRAVDEAEPLICLRKWPDEFNAFEARLLRNRCALENARSFREDILARHFKVRAPSSATMKWRNFSLNVCESRAEQVAQTDASSIRTAERLNIGLIPSLLTRNASIPELLSWMSLFSSNTEFKKPHSEHLYCKSIENVFFKKVCLPMEYTSDTEISDLITIISKYRDCVARIRQRVGSGRMLLSELKSRVVLVVWCALCLVHNSMKIRYTEMSNYALAPNMKLLKRVVLSQKVEIDALLKVCSYVHANSKLPKKPIFSLLQDDATMDLAKNISASSPSILKIIKDEENHALCQERTVWSEVEGKKRSLNELDKELIKYENNYSNSLGMERSWIETKTSSHDSKCRQEYQEKYDICKGNSAALKWNVEQTKARIRKAESPPFPLYQSLPKDRDLALKVTFFLFMPSSLNIYATLSMMAQQLLLPEKSYVDENAEVEKSLETEPPKTIWKNYYRSECTWRTASALPSSFILGSRSQVPEARLWYPDNVRKIFTVSQVSLYPDVLVPSLYWNGGDRDSDKLCSNYFNPFVHLSSMHMMRSFTDNLPSLEKNSQWMVSVPEENLPSERENHPETQLTRIPHFFTRKPEFLSFSTLRSHPLCQLRNVCSALSERTLDLHQHDVQVLICGVLYQVGDIVVSDGKFSLSWWTDREKFLGISTLNMILGGIVSEIEHKPRDSSTVIILSEMLFYLSQWNSHSRELSCRLGIIAEKWADDLLEVEGKYSPQNCHEIQAQRRLYYMYAICCHAHESLTENDASQIAKCVILGNNIGIMDEKTSYDSKIETANFIFKNRLVHCIDSLLEIVQRKSEVVSNALRYIITDIPNDLSWEHINLKDGCAVQTIAVSATSSLGNVYSVNLITGAILFNGLPLQQLPPTIRDSTLYQRSFGDNVFEVTKISGGGFQAMRSIEGRFYRFYDCDDSGVPGIEESKLSCFSNSYRLLDGTSTGSKKWGGDIPEPLQSMHSHWLCEADGVLVLRPKKFDRHEIQFIFQKREDCIGESNGLPLWKCFRVPKNRQHFSYEKILELADLDILISVIDYGQSNIQDILRCVEHEDSNIHVYLQPSGLLMWDLPRFSLEFEVGHDQSVVCKSFKGFILSIEQHFKHTLHGFRDYLILESEAGLKVLIPSGTVVWTDNGPYVKCSSSREQNIHIYDVHHRFRTVDACAGEAAIHARLQLAVCYALCGTLLPEELTGKTGAEMAIELVRQSWANKPYGREESELLQQLQVCSQKNSALKIISSETECNGNKLSFLYCKDINSRLKSDSMAQSEYKILKRRDRLSFHSILFDYEEREVFGKYLQWDDNSRRSYTPFLEIGEVENGGLGQYCDFLSKHLVITKESGSVSTPVEPFTLPTKFRTTKLSAEQTHDLEKSINVHRGLSKLSISNLSSASIQEVQKLAHLCTEDVKQLQKSCLSALENIPGTRASTCLSYNIDRAIHRKPFPTARDLVSQVYMKTKFTDFNPFHSASSVSNFISLVLQWMEMCVFEDKIQRILGHLAAGKLENVLSEAAETKRDWLVKEHPRWLAFEVENNLQIRRVQFQITEFCIQNHGLITQLNMGEGKTRVVLPMIILEDPHPNILLRLFIMAPLLSEAYQFLHRTLTASLHFRRFFLLPFHRDVVLSPARTSMIYEELQMGIENRSVLCVSPEQRLSLHLKLHELNCGDLSKMKGTSEWLQKIEELPSFDIFDESDELLSHKYQLTYAIGMQGLLPSGSVRWSIAQMALKQFQSNYALKKLIASFVSRSKRSECASGSFDGVRLLSGDRLLENSKRIAHLVCEGVLSDLSLEISWIRSSCMRPTIISFVTDPMKSEKWLAEQCKNVGNDTFTLTTPRLDVLLTLRGLLSFGTMEHVLLKRHRVDYGVDFKRGATHRTAVPFLACDTPSDRAEYAHVDILILFTQLSYYHTGLSIPEVKEAIQVLQRMGPIAQAAEYKKWFSSGSGTMTKDQLSGLDMAEKIDASCADLIKTMHTVYRYNMALVNFWLSKCVLPMETMQFPYRISANAFNLADNSKGLITGFSGTKDRQRLLPIQVSQCLPQSDVIRATDGKMYDIIMENDEVHTVAGDNISNTMVNLVHDLGVDAIIDSGALMAGMSNEDVALKYVELCNTSERYGGREGVVYFNAEEKEWMAMNWELRCWKLGASPITEKHAVVFFDESHCRGADMKLKPNAKGIVSVGPSMSKDKLMQAAGRMRNLGKGQTICFAMPQEVVMNMKPAGGPLQSKDILHWTLNNSIQQAEEGLVDWASQGVQFCATREPKNRLTVDAQDLATLYGSPLVEEDVYTISRRQEKLWRDSVSTKGVPLQGSSSDTLVRVQGHIKNYGSDYQVIVRELNQACEREVEQEREVEVENIRYLAEDKLLPRVPYSWNYSILPRCKKVKEIEAEAAIIHINEISKTWGTHGFHKINWEICNLMGTKNFFTALPTDKNGCSEDLSEYQRPVDGILFFLKTRSFVMTSEHESGEILKVLWHSDIIDMECVFLNFFQISTMTDCSQILDCSMRVPQLVSNSLNNLPEKEKIELENTVTALRLFAGKTEFKTLESQKALARLLPSEESRESAKLLINVRGFSNMLPSSDLEKLCLENE